MKAPRAIILYENKRNGDSGYGLHDFNVECVLDECSRTQDRCTARRICSSVLDARPMNGNSKALDDSIRLAQRGIEHVILVLDADKLGRLKRERRSAFKKLASTQVQLVELKENAESVLAQIADARSADVGLRTRALVKKTHNDRDTLAGMGVRHLTPGQRASIVGDVPGLRKLVDLLKRFAEAALKMQGP